MICDLVEAAQNGDKGAMLDLIKKFMPLFKKYAIKLKYEDAYQDILLYYIELIKRLNLKKLTATKDEILVSYINISIINFYKKKMQKLIVERKEIVFSDLTEEQVYYADVQSAKEDKINVPLEFGMKKILNENEYRILYLIYIEGYNTAEIARGLHKSRQTVNQTKQRALRKIKNAMQKQVEKRGWDNG